MKLISFYRNKTLCGGAAVGGFAVELDKAAKAMSCGVIPGSIREMLEGGDPVMARARKTVRRAEAKLEWVAKKVERRPIWAHPLQEVELAPPVPNPEKIICVGQNYADHCREQNVELPKTPIIFAKFANTLCGAHSQIPLPPESVAAQIDFEVELAFVIGREAKRIRRANAMDYVAGFTILNDVTARDVQRADGQWVRGKSFDGFGPCGPWLATTDEFSGLVDYSNLRLWLRVNGQTMQDGVTSEMIFDVPFLIEYLSRSMTLKPGDIISTGTPPGVGIHRKPPVTLQPGDIVEAGIDGLGALKNKCTRDRG